MIRPVTPANLEEAARLLRRGELVAFPTETVYGLGADAMNAEAVARIFEAKRRPFFDPLIVHVGSIEAARILWAEVPEEAEKLMKAFWPGPLTVVLPKRGEVPDLVTAGLDTVAVRMPSHPGALGLLRAFGGPIAAPSANPFGRTSPTTARHVEEDLGAAVPLILDGGACGVGVESTVVKIEKNGFRILRPGGISAEEISRHLPALPGLPGLTRPRPEAPGMLESHYAPLTKLVLFDRLPAGNRTEFARAGLLTLAPRAEAEWFAASEALSPTGDLREAAQNLFAAMRRLDALKLRFIAAERVAPEGLGAAILDRLAKASSGQSLEYLLSN